LECYILVSEQWLDPKCVMGSELIVSLLCIVN